MEHTARHYRYEYRVFGSNLQPAADRLASHARTSKLDGSDDTYIVSRDTSASSVKLRDAALEIKRLEFREGLFELWAPILRAEFPLSARIIRERVAPSLGVKMDLAATRSFRVDDLLEIVNEAETLAAVTVRKARTKLTLEDGLAEFVELSILGKITESVAVEAPDLVAAQRLLKLADIADLPNESYPTLLNKLICFS
jgi:hypothetical protein